MSQDQYDKIRRQARLVLVALGVMFVLSASLVVLVVSYPRSFEAWSDAFATLHYLTGDAAIVLSGVYVWLHLARVWRFKKFQISRWSGLFLTGLWSVGAATGVVWQFGVNLDAGATEGGHTTLYHLHWLACLLAAVCAAAHGLYAFRPKNGPEDDPPGLTEK